MNAENADHHENKSNYYLYPSLMSMEDLISKLEQHVFNDKFALEFEDFANKNCDCFEDTEENKLEYTAIHNEFCANFNSRIEGMDNTVFNSLI